MSSDESKRSATRRDRDRILYSDSFRRLGGVTQVALGDPSLELHNRLTHSLKVEQVGFSICSLLTSYDKDFGNAVNENVVAAASLGHDIGHPPFGHAGESELQQILMCSEHLLHPRRIDKRKSDPCPRCLLEDGFEGNAQSFRALAVLAVHRDSEERPLGLDLTRATLAAVSKYPWTRGAPGRKINKWGAYDCDAPILEWVFGTTDAPQDAPSQVMDWADDISYAVHDLEDFYRTGRIPLENYNRVTNGVTNDRYEEFIEYVESHDAHGQISDECKKSLPNYFAYFPRSAFQGRPADLAALDRMRSRFLNAFISAAEHEHPNIPIDPLRKEVNAIMKQFVWFHVIDDPKLGDIQRGQRRVIREIFDDLLPMLESIYRIGSGIVPSERQKRTLPYALKRAIEFGVRQQSSYTDRQVLIRGLVDYISSLSDAGAYRLHGVLKGREGYGIIH
ncbi:deoxyguanosinetriphosphate triphosphohydrolase family protein [Mycolicibacterium sp.]|uniref:deoxyguanosinetriphosphate triphosphohydrolase family protein n=1 Tax=Mycolicibacterium sp. TaxID=2320850 RepID=UPI0037CA0FB3